MAALLVLLGSVLALLALLIVGDLRTGGGIRQALRAPHTPPTAPLAGSVAADLTGTRPDGTPVTIPISGTRASTLLAFLGSTCLTCDGLWRGADRADRGARDLRIVVVTRGPEVESSRLVASKAPRSVPVVMSEAAWVAYGVRAAPAFVVVDASSGTPISIDVSTRWPGVIDAARAAR